jgi:hypothetical protein
MSRRRRTRRTPRTPRQTQTIPVAKIGGPGELMVILPQLLGFTPHESLIVLSLREPRGRLGLVQRIDLLPDDDLPDDAVMAFVQRCVADGATKVVIAVWTEEQDCAAGRPQTPLVERLGAAARSEGLMVQDALLVRSGRWWSYICGEPRCCPPEGTPLSDSAASDGVLLTAAETALSGRATLASRAELERSIAPNHPFGEEAAIDMLMQVAWEQQFQRLEDVDAQRAEASARWQAAIQGYRDPRHRLDDDERRYLIASLIHGPTRDVVLRAALDDQAELQRLLEELCRWSAPPFDATLCTTLGFVAYLGGGGAIVTIAAERALADDPDFVPADTLLALMGQGIPPDELRATLRRGMAIEEAAADGSPRRPRRSA